jgi:hypothetical protein
MLICHLKHELAGNKPQVGRGTVALALQTGSLGEYVGLQRLVARSEGPCRGVNAGQLLSFGTKKTALAANSCFISNLPAKSA